MQQHQPIYMLPTGVVSKRISSYDRTGGNSDYIRIGAHETVDIARIQGAGFIRHIWITINTED